MAKLHDAQKRYNVVITYYDTYRTIPIIGRNCAIETAILMFNGPMSDPIYSIRVDDSITGETVYSI